MLFGKKKEIEIVSPCDGECVALSKVPDPVFAQEMMGPGVAIEPTSGTIGACIDGTLCVVAPTGHAYGLTQDSGLEVLVHIGIDTVEMKGDGFQVLKKVDQVVSRGEPIIQVDLEKIKQAKHPSVIPIVLTDQESVVSIQKREPGPVHAGEWILKVVMK